MVFDLCEKGWKWKHLPKNTELALTPAYGSLDFFYLLFQPSDGALPLLPSLGKSSIVYHLRPLNENAPS